MIARLIRWCAHNRALVILLTSLLVAGGVWSTYRLTVDAIPDLSDVQVVIRTEYPGQAPQIVEDQVTYPLTTAMLAVPYAKVVRGYSMFGTSFVYIIFEDGTDLYWARSRVLEQLSAVAGQLPRGASPSSSVPTRRAWAGSTSMHWSPASTARPIRTARGTTRRTNRWYASPDAAPEEAQPRLVHHRVFETARYLYRDPLENKRYYSPQDAPLEVRSRLEAEEIGHSYDKCPLDGQPLLDSKQNLADLRSQQDWYLRYALTAVDGVSEVAPIGGFVKQYQVVVDPVKLLGLNIPLSKIKLAIQRSNVDVGGRLLEMSETEYMVRGVGYLGSLTDAGARGGAARGSDHRRGAQRKGARASSRKSLWAQTPRASRST